MSLRSAMARSPRVRGMCCSPPALSVAPRPVTAMQQKSAMARRPAARATSSFLTAPTAAPAASAAQAFATNLRSAAARSEPPTAMATEAAKRGASRWSAPTKSPCVAVVRSPADPSPRCPTARPAAPASLARTGSVAETNRFDLLRPQRPRCLAFGMARAKRGL